MFVALTALAAFAAPPTELPTVQPGTTQMLMVEGAPAGTEVFLFVSLHGEGQGPCLGEFGGACFDILHPGRFERAVAAADGTVTFSSDVSERLAGRQLSMQAMTPRGAEGFVSQPLTVAVAALPALAAR